MNRMRVCLVALALGAALPPEVVNAQSIDVVGARAAGMAGAFVGVADDASAAYWNPGALAAGAYVSLVLDGGPREAIPDLSLHGQKQSGFFIGIAMPALAVSYYRLENTTARPFELLVPVDGSAPGTGVNTVLPVRLDSLVTHHAGITLVQSIIPNVAVGTTLKLVRGIAASESAGFTTAEEALDRVDLVGRSSTEFDFDFGAMATFGAFKAGVTVRNVREPEFDLPDESVSLRLDRQARAGVSYGLSSNWLVAADVDILEHEDAFGDRRDIALGIEGRVLRRLTVRSGARFNAAGSEPDDAFDRGRAFAFGASFAARASILIDAAAVMGDDRAGRAWKVGARFIY